MKTWLTPFADIWEEEMRGEPPYGPMAKFLKPLVKKHGDGVVKAWRKYLKVADPLYANPARFAQTYGNWVPQETHQDLRFVD